MVNLWAQYQLSEAFYAVRFLSRDNFKFKRMSWQPIVFPIFYYDNMSMASYIYTVPSELAPNAGILIPNAKRLSESIEQ